MDQTEENHIKDKLLTYDFIRAKIDTTKKISIFIYYFYFF